MLRVLLVAFLAIISLVAGITRDRFSSHEKLVSLGLKLFGDDGRFDNFLTMVSDPPKRYDVETFRGTVKMILSNTLAGDALDIWGNRFGHQKNIAPKYRNNVFAPYRLDRMVYNETGKVHQGNYFMHDGVHSGLQRHFEGVLIDVGSNVGGFTVFSALSYPLLEVYAIEPSPTSFWLLNYNLYLNNLLDDPRVHTFHMAVGVPAEKWDTYVTLIDNVKDSQLSHLSLNGTANYTTETESTKVKCQVLARPFTVWQAEHNITKINFLKVDCEGCEWYLLPELSRAVLRKRRIEHLGLHLRLLEPNVVTDADKPPQGNIAKTEWLLDHRPGCGNMRMWIHQC